MKHKLAALIQILIGAALLALIFHRLHTHGELDNLRAAFAGAASHPGWLLLGLAGFGISLLACARRWHLILHAQNFPLRFGQTVELTLIGQFFNVFMLGATGGDVVKALYVSRHSQGRKTEIVTSIAIDRLIGLIAIIVMAPCAMLLRLDIFWARPESRAMLLLALAVLAIKTVGLLLLFGPNLVNRVPLFKRWAGASAVGNIAARAYEAFHFVLRHRGLLPRTLALSAINHLAFVLTGAAFGRALELPLNAIDYIACFFAINLISSIPITPSGIGTRDSATLMLLVPLGVSAGQAVSLSLMQYGAILVWGLIGGLVYAPFALRGGSDKSLAEARRTRR